MTARVVSFNGLASAEGVRVDDVVSEMLRVMNAEFPAVEQMTGPQARAAIAARRVPADDLDDVRATVERVVPSAGGSIPIRVYQPHGSGDALRGAVVFCHGGGFVFCDLESHDGFCRAMSKYTHTVVVSVDYRLAPEHRAPAAAEDAFAAFSWVIANAAELGIDPARVAVAGDSAGGNLAAVTAILCRERAVTMPAAQVLLYPMIDPSTDTASCRRLATGYVTTRAALRWYWRQYLGGATVPEPAYVVAPAHAASHAGLPPALVVTAGLDPLHSEGVDYARRLKYAGVPVVLRDYPGLFHGFLTIMSFDAAAAARELLWADMRRLLAPAEERAR
jgi:acetyl esterase/lipase